MAAKRLSIIGHHLIWTLYGHWLANDLRGSGSLELHEEKFAPLGPVHHGRKPEQLQPSRGELREFYKQADPLLKFSKFWLDAAKRQAWRLSTPFGRRAPTKCFCVHRTKCVRGSPTSSGIPRGRGLLNSTFSSCKRIIIGPFINLVSAKAQTDVDAFACVFANHR